ILVHAGIALAVATVGAGWRRYLFPARVPVEAAGLAALWLGISRRTAVDRAQRGLYAAAVVAIACGWGVAQTARGLAEARSAVESRGLPAVAPLRALSVQ